ncbi:MAG TPA: hypothetical protein VI583_03380, partial [Cyclobacteriaceae bacterium]|nr:hypothetical protein [Cyclobacteriaceae bacterium]
MFRKILVIVLTALSTVVHAQDGDSLEVHDDWRLEKDDDGVRVYVRWKKNEEGIKTRQLRVEMIVQSSISAVVAVVKDDKYAEEWINRAEEFYNFDIRDDHHWYSYTEFDVPWPLNNQDLVTSNNLIQDKDSKSVNIEIRNDPQKIPVKKHIDRMPGFEG